MQTTITITELEAAINFWRQRSPSVGEELRYAKKPLPSPIPTPCWFICVANPSTWTKCLRLLNKPGLPGSQARRA